MHRFVGRLWSDDQGQDLIEYALMLTLILLVTLAAIQGIAAQVSQIFISVNTVVSNS